MFRIFTQKTLLLIVSLGVFWGGVFLLDPLLVLDEQITDLFFVEQEPQERIVVVKIDDKSLNDIGQWPWPRAVFADFLDHVQSAAVVGIDVNFREPSRFGPADDAVLTRALATSGVPIVLPVQIQEQGVTRPLPQFIGNNAVYAGFSNLVLDGDGVVRRAHYRQGEIHSFGLQLHQLRHNGRKNPPLRHPQPFRILFSRPGETYPLVSFSDVLSGSVPTELIDGATIIVGVTASDLRSFINTPFGLMSAPEIHANITEVIAQRRFPASSPITDLIVVLVMTFAAAIFALRSHSIVWLIAGALGMVILYEVVVLVLFDGGIILDPLYPPLAAIGSVFVTTAYEYVLVSHREALVRRSYNTLEVLLRSMVDGVVMLDTNLRVVVSNPAARTVVGVESDAYLSFTHLESAVGNDLHLREVVSAVMRTGEVRSVRDVVIGSTYFEVIVAPFSAPAKEVLSDAGAVVLLHDITQEKEIERIRKDFTSMMVHELRSPLDAIKKIAQQLESGVDKQKRDKYLSLVHSNASQMLSLVNDLLDVAKIESGEFELHRDSARIRELLEDRVRFYQPLTSGQQIDFSVSDDVPAEVYLDEKRMKQVLNNLLSNAIKFTEEGDNIHVHADVIEGGTLPEEVDGISIHWFDDTDRLPKSVLVLSVSDSGAGIPQSEIPQLFDKFKQFEAAARSEEKGTGLGLSIVRGITKQHGGTVGVAAEEGVGAQFYIVLPLTSADQNDR